MEAWPLAYAIKDFGQALFKHTKELALASSLA